MATLRERDVFEYCENLFEKLKKEDGGYYPHKHDRLVFEKTAEHFSISDENVRKIYDSYTKLAAQMEMLKIRRLPKKKQQAAMMRKMQDIVLNNKDLPFYKKEGEPASPILPATITIEEELKAPVSNIANAGWTIPLTIDVEQLSELTSCCDCQHIDSFFEKFYTDSKIRELYDIILPSIDNIGQRKRFEECYSMFEQGMYSSCLTVLTTIFEGMVSTFGDDPTDVRIMRICNFHA